MTKHMNEEKLRARLRKKQNGRTLADFAKEIGVTPGYLSEVYGGRRSPGGKILAHLGLVKDPPTYSEVEIE
jgi:transcriptional regulator with XRE-family HTH domain